ncbi:hypothetical protein QVD17_10419 [Tagetes erecta]|uniref:EF-hand domain-containing protein n=1 Tax=Tagetes erecta TaxID=13708 RepID=A0AAD8L5Q1_TARER|nr:hypothetical protein QVD17_10419 [Tagetes erecta]
MWWLNAEQGDKIGEVQWCQKKCGNVSEDGKRELTIKEFKKWLMKFDVDNDGRISKSELRQIIKASGGWFSRWKASNGIKAADRDGNGFVDGYEIENLIHFAQKEMGVRIIP